MVSLETNNLDRKYQSCDCIKCLFLKKLRVLQTASYNIYIGKHLHVCLDMNGIIMSLYVFNMLDFLTCLHVSKIDTPLLMQ